MTTSLTVDPVLPYENIIPATWSHYFIIFMAVAAIAWAVVHAVMVSISSNLSKIMNLTFYVIGRESRNGC